MKKTVFVNGLVALCAVTLLLGCATGAKGPSDDEMIRGTIEKFRASFLGKDIETVMTTLSNDFYHPELGDKEAAKGFLQQGIDSGYVDGGEIDLANMEIKIEGDKATVYPVVASASAGSVTVGFTLKKETDGKTVNWLIIEINVEGV